MSIGSLRRHIRACLPLAVMRLLGLGWPGLSSHLLLLLQRVTKLGRYHRELLTSWLHRVRVLELVHKSRLGLQRRRRSAGLRLSTWLRQVIELLVLLARLVIEPWWCDNANNASSALKHKVVLLRLVILMLHAEWLRFSHFAHLLSLCVAHMDLLLSHGLRSCERHTLTWHLALLLWISTLLH